MKHCVFVVLLVILLPTAEISARHIGKPRSRTGRGGHHHHHHHHHSAASTQPTKKVEGDSDSYAKRIRSSRPGPADTVKIAGSSLPNCSHACGSCSPCRLVMVSFVCASLEEAETCPMAYKCMCNHKSFPVP